MTYKIHIISAYTDNLIDMINVSKPILSEYCYRNNYSYDIFNIPTDYIRPYSWFKIDKLIQIDNDYDYILWMDADSVIVNKQFKIESIINKNKYFYISKDLHNINCGVFMIHNNNYMKKFLENTWNKTQYLNHCWWEQAAIIDSIENNIFNISQYIEYIPQCVLNAYDYKYYSNTKQDGQVTANSFIFHCPGLDHRLRLELLVKYAKL